MKDSRAPWLVAVTAASALAFPRLAIEQFPAGVPTPAGRTSYQPRSADLLLGNECSRDARLLVQEYFGPEPETRDLTTCKRCAAIKWFASDLSSPAAAGDLRECSTCLNQLAANGDEASVATLTNQHETNFLIATVPDPIDAHVGWLFDDYLDSIERAAQASGYVLDRYSLPWECDRQAKGDTGDKSGGDDKDDTPRALGRLRESTPGVLLFRNSDSKKKDLLIVFLVGETPTAGIHKKAFEAALDEVVAINAEPKPHFYVMGPAFSGSVASLRIAAQRWWCPRYAHCAEAPSKEPRPFQVISGDATLKGNKTDLEDLRCNENSDPLIRFSATVIPDDALEKALCTYLGGSVGFDAGKVALLSESGSAYGGEEDRSPCGQKWVDLRFPMHIAEMRAAAYQGGPQTNQGRSDAPLRDAIDKAQRPAVELSLHNAGEPHDLPDVFHPEVSNSKTELALAQTLSTISRLGIQYVGIKATDIRDLLFLARQIHTYTPDVRLFTFDNDVLLTHPEYQVALEGMIVVSTYPLWSENQWWLAGSTERELVQFSSQAAEGAYNATLALLNKTGGDGKGTAPLVEYSVPLADPPPATPPVWLSVVGHRALWPLQFYRTFNCGEPCGPDHVNTAGYLAEFERSREKTGPLSEAVDWGQLPRNLFLLTGLICFATALGYFGTWEFWPFQLFRPQDSNPQWQSIYAAACFEVLLVGYAYFAGIMTRTDQWRVPSLGLVLALPLIAAARNAIKVKIGFGRTLAAAAAPLLVFLGTMIFYGPWFSGEGFQTKIFLRRTLTLSSGVSALLPVWFLAASAVAWAICHIRRSTLLGVANLRTPFNPVGEEPNAGAVSVGAGIAELEERVRHAIRRPFCTALQLTSAAFMFLVPTLLIGTRFQSFEGAAFTCVFGLAGALAFSGTALIFFHFLSIWGCFRKYLGRLALHPMRRAYGRLPLRPRSFGGHFSAQAPTVEDLEVVIQHWTLLADRFKALRVVCPTKDTPWEQVENDVRQIQTDQRSFATDLDRAAQSGGEDVSASGTYKRLRNYAGHLVLQLEQWWQSTAPIGREAGKKEPIPRRKETMQVYAENSGSDANALWLRLAEDFIAIQVVLFINVTFAHLRNLLTFVIVGLILLLLALTSYPFEPQRLILSMLGSTIIAVVVASLVVFVQVERDQVLSLIAHTKPNHITLNRGFTTMVLLYAALPLLAVIATYFPALGDLFSYLDPVLRIFRG